MPEVKIIGAGLAGSEAALQLAKRGIKVKLYEMRPNKTSRNNFIKCVRIKEKALRRRLIAAPQGLLTGIKTSAPGETPGSGGKKEVI